MDDRDILVVPELEEALIGEVYNQFYEQRVAVYSVPKCLEIFKAHGMTQEQAQEHLEFNYLQAYVGVGSPLYVGELIGEEC
jgi:hypothetical protein